MWIYSKNKFIRRTALLLKTPIAFVLGCVIVVKEDGFVHDFVEEWKEIWNWTAEKYERKK